MAGHLLAAGHSLVLYTRTKKRAEALLKRGATWASSPAEAATAADIVFLCVTDTPDVETIVLGERGLLHAARQGLVIVDHSTISPSTTRRLADTLADKGTHFLDAPVSGGDIGARNATLSIMVGGDQPAYEHALPLLQLMGKTITLLGPVGSGGLVKLINNFVCGVQIAAIAEAIAMMERGGLDRAKALEILTAGAPGSPLVKTVSARMTQPDYTPNFLLRLMAKDLTYARQEAINQSLHLATASAALEVFESAIAAGHGEKDIAAVIEPLRRK